MIRVDADDCIKAISVLIESTPTDLSLASDAIGVWKADVSSSSSSLVIVVASSGESFKCISRCMIELNKFSVNFKLIIVHVIKREKWDFQELD